MDKLRITSLILSEDAVRDQNGKNIIVGPLPDMKFEVMPNYFSFSINFAVLNLKPQTPYNLETEMIQHNGERIIHSKLEGLTLNAHNSGKSTNSFINMGVKNQKFTCFGNCKVIVSIEEQNNPEIKDSMTLIVPILQRG